MTLPSLFGKSLATVAGTTIVAASFLSATPAKALTFFFESSDITLNGSYTIDDAAFDSLVASLSNITITDPLTSFIADFDNSGLFSSTIAGSVEGFLLEVKTNESVKDEFGGPFSPFAVTYRLELTAPEGGLGVCKFQQCEGIGSIGGKGGPAGIKITQKPASVPEPTAMLGLGVIGSLFLLGKRSKSAIS